MPRLPGHLSHLGTLTAFGLRQIPQLYRGRKPYRESVSRKSCRVPKIFFRAGRIVKSRVDVKRSLNANRRLRCLRIEPEFCVF